MNIRVLSSLLIWGLDIINNVREARESLHRMADDFRIGNASWCERLVR
jgi:hypothetical protein